MTEIKIDGASLEKNCREIGQALDRAKNIVLNGETVDDDEEITAPADTGYVVVRDEGDRLIVEQIKNDIVIDRVESDKF